MTGKEGIIYKEWHIYIRKGKNFMNENAFFQKADYTKNQNLVFEDNTIYEVDPACMGRQGQRGETVNNTQNLHKGQQVTEEETANQEDIEVKNVDDTAYRTTGKNEKKDWIWLWLFLLCCCCRK